MIRIVVGDALTKLRAMRAASIDLCLTSPPYNIGKEYEVRVEIEKYMAWIKPIAAECVRVLRPGGSLCWQIGIYVSRQKMARPATGRKSSAELLPLDYLFFPLFKELGLELRNRIIWTFGHGLHAKHRFSGRHETLLWFTKGKPSFNVSAVRERMGSVWDIPNVKSNHPEKTAHPCQFPENLAERVMAELTKPGDEVLDPFAGAGTVGVVADRMRCSATLIEMQPEYARIAEQRIRNAAPPNAQIRFLRAA